MNQLTGFYQKRVGRQEKYPRHGALRGLLIDRKNTLNFIELKRETARLITMRPKPRKREQDYRSIRSFREFEDSEKVRQYVFNIADVKLEAQEMNQPSLIETVDGCRSEKIQMRTDTCVRLSGRKPQLHMNAMEDYYRQKLIICQAPLPHQFADHWQAIWEQKVGVVVWIGEFQELNKPKIDPYIPLKGGGKIAYGEFYITTSASNTSGTQFDFYNVQVDFELECRFLMFLRARFWPDHRMPDESAQLADFVSQIQNHVYRQSHGYDLSALLVHCSLGMQRSPAFLAVYIGRQMWFDVRICSVSCATFVGNRWKAFGYGDPFAQVQIVFGVMQVVAIRFETEGIGNLVVLDQERRVFDTAARKAEGKMTWMDRTKRY